MKVLPNAVALLVDVVGSRATNRRDLHRALLAAIEQTNQRVPALDPLRVTVADELQGVYPTLGDALHAGYELRNLVFGAADLRCGMGGGEVHFIDPGRGIQDGSAWWLAREATDFVEALAAQPGYASARTSIRDSRDVAAPHIDATVRLIDSALAKLRNGSRRSLIGLLAGLDNAAVATAEGISESANSQRVNSGELRILADAMQALYSLP